MNKIKSCSMLLIATILSSLVLASTTVQIPLIGVTPIYEEQKFEPLLFLKESGGRVLFDDPYGPFANGDITQRNDNYAFTGEQIQWEVLLWDKNGVPEKINDVFAGWVTQTNGPLDPEQQVNCQLGEQLDDSKLLSEYGYSNVRRPNDQEPQLYYNNATMGIYVCTLTIEPSCHGQKWMGVKVVDIDNLTGTMQEAESWFCNPAIDLTLSGEINFGLLGPGEQGASTFSVQNSAEPNSGVEVIVAISGTDFYDPSNSGAKCPITNSLALQGDGMTFTTGFWYTAVMGANIVGNKRIPYGNGIMDADPIFSSGNGLNPTYTPLVPMSPGSEASITLHLGLPQPCNGQFTDGQLYLYALAI